MLDRMPATISFAFSGAADAHGFSGLDAGVDARLAPRVPQPTAVLPGASLTTSPVASPAVLAVAPSSASASTPAFGVTPGAPPGVLPDLPPSTGTPVHQPADLADVAAGYAVGMPSDDGIPGPRSATRRRSAGHAAHAPRLIGRPVRVAAPGAHHRRSLLCGIAADEAGGEGRVICGIPLRRDRQTGAPYVVPLYEQPRTGVVNSPGSTADAAAQRMQAAVSARLRQQALELLSRFLDAAPVDVASGIDAPTLAPGMYPVPSKVAPAGMDIVDMEPTRGVAPGFAFPGGFL